MATDGLRSQVQGGGGACYLGQEGWVPCHPVCNQELGGSGGWEFMMLQQMTSHLAFRTPKWKCRQK